jgi:hypothetical protein
MLSLRRENHQFGSGGVLTRLLQIVVVLTLLSCVPLCAQSAINTIPLWNGSSFISAFGVTNTATYGQTITVPANAGNLLSFSFEIGFCTAPVTFRGHVYLWNGTMATGASLFNSAPQTIPSDNVYHLVTFSPGIPLPPGQYILFASTSEDQGAAPPSGCRWGALTNDNGDPGGQFKFLNNGPDPTQWTSVTWSSISEDLAFSVAVSGNAFAVPTLSEWGMIIMACLLAGGGYWKLRRKRVPITSTN